MSLFPCVNVSGPVFFQDCKYEAICGLAGTAEPFCVSVLASYLLAHVPADSTWSFLASLEVEIL